MGDPATVSREIDTFTSAVTMDPARRAMIEGRGSPSKRDVTSPRHDSHSRISKPSSKSHSNVARNAVRHLTEDEQSRQSFADEDKFVLKQSKKKADIRVREGRATPIDLLAFHLRSIDTDRDILDDNEADANLRVPDPIKVIDGLSLAQITELEPEITSYHTLEGNRQNRTYWKALRALVSDRKAKLNPSSHEGRVMNSVGEDIDRILAPKTHAAVMKGIGTIHPLPFTAPET